MTKRNIVETIYEYDNEGKLLKKIVTETHEEDDVTYGYTTTSKPYIIESSSECTANCAISSATEFKA